MGRSMKRGLGLVRGRGVRSEPTLSAVFQPEDGEDERRDEGFRRSVGGCRFAGAVSPEPTVGSTRDHVTVVSGDDETFQDIFRDFSDMASHDPEKLSRQHSNRVGDESN